MIWYVLLFLGGFGSAPVCMLAIDRVRYPRCGNRSPNNGKRCILRGSTHNHHLCQNTDGNSHWWWR